MIVYSGTKAQFRTDVFNNDIGQIILKTFVARTGRHTAQSEIDSWSNSLGYMDRVLGHDEIPDDAGVAIEYHIPQTSKRIDFILTGKDDNEEDTAVLVELKQWQKAEATAQDGLVRTRLKRGEVLTAHPCYQAWSYKRLLEDFNQVVQEEAIRLYPCAYLHNYDPDDDIASEFYRAHIERAPLFLKNDAAKLQSFIRQHVRHGDRDQIMYRIDHGKIRPSKSLADCLASMLNGNPEFTMIDDQKVVYETSLMEAARAMNGKKRVVIVEGGPGTGKSVVAINLMVEMTARELVVRYVTRNSAPREVYEAKLTGSFRKSHISNMFGSTGAFHSIDPDSYDCLIVDEAHRLNEKSGLFNHLGENQIREIIRSSRCSVFFIDEDQRVTLKDIGEKREIVRWAKVEKASVTELALESQFRCNGSDGYLAWIDHTLQIRDTANPTLEHADYDFAVVDSPDELHDWIREKNKQNNKARMVAGYCWDWISKKNSNLKDIAIDNYRATWNLDEDGQGWLAKSTSAEEVGCIHTCQGLELDYVGVIVGLDLIVRNGQILTQPERRSKMDRSISGWKKRIQSDPKGGRRQLDTIIRNTYRTLMTRGLKACRIYCVDAETQRYFIDCAGQTEAELIPYENALPLLSLRAVADSAYASLDGRFADSEEFQWQLVRGGPFPRDRFVVRAEGDSMEPTIKGGDLCIFRRDPGGSRNGKIVLCQIAQFAGDEPLACIKKYRSARIGGKDSIGEASAIVLSSINETHEDIVLTGGEHLSIIGVFESTAETDWP